MPTQYGEDIAVLKDQMKDVKSSQERMETKLDVVIANYATKAELRTFKVITIPMVIILTAVLTGLVAFYFAHRNEPVPTTTSSTQTTTTNSSTPSTGQSIPSSSASSSVPQDPTDSQTNGGVQITLPKVLP